MRTFRTHSYLKCVTLLNSQQPCLRTNTYNQLLMNKSNGIIAPLTNTHQLRWKSEKNDISSIVIPVPLAPVNSVNDIIGEELTSKIHKEDILEVINQFFKQPEVKKVAAEKGLDSELFDEAASKFRDFCMEPKPLPTELHIILSDILQKAAHVTEILPSFLDYAKKTFPLWRFKEDLKKISDLRQPSNWYPDARKINRKLIFHAGPTNSGKTYRALERFMNSKSGVYCGPLKLLSVEVFKKTNEKGTLCDLVTGEEKQMVSPDDTPANHVACTIEMVSVQNKYEVAVIDEIQMIKDPRRGWAWTRALLGLCADEIHICGEAAAIDLVKEIASSCGEELEVRKYERLTPLTIENNALMDLNKIQPGDCIVCFSKNDIFTVCLELEKRGYECAVIYGGLPPGTKLAQAQKFNDPNHPCKILVATDAIGMGLNLSIRRIIFYSLKRPVINEKNEKEIDTISVSQALQIAGRAGRFNTQFSEGFVTTFRNADLSILKSIMAKDVPKLDKAGLHITEDQVQLFAYSLPKENLSNVINILRSYCILDTSSYFLCDTEGIQSLAESIQHIHLHLRGHYEFCLAPINIRDNYVRLMFTKFARQYYDNIPMTSAELNKMIGWPFSPPKNTEQLAHQESVFDVLDLYLWLSYRFKGIFLEVQEVRKTQQQLDEIIQQGVFNIRHLFKAREAKDDVTDLTDHKYKSSVDSADNLDPDNIKRFGKNFPKGPLTEKLLRNGILTPEEVRIFQKECLQSLGLGQSAFNSLKSKTNLNHSKRNRRK